MSVSERNKRIILTKSGNRCAFPRCNQILVIEKTEEDPYALVAEIAHIKGENSDSARYDPNMTDEERNDPENLIVMCPTHHKVIDDQPNQYTVEKLIEIKNKHEGWVITQTYKEVGYIGFNELKVVTKFLMSSPFSSTNFDIIPIKEKIAKNSLSPSIENSIKRGMSRISLVKKYIDKSPDIYFGERLKQAFVDKYEELTDNEKLQGDKLFEALLEFASGGSNKFREIAAGLTVLCYFFEKCDVFEK